MPSASRWTNGVLLMAALLLTITLAAPVQAHGYIVRSIPEDRATLERPPTRIQYWFSEDLAPQFSEITLLDATGQMIAEGEVDAEDVSLMTLRPPTDLPDGAYVVSLRPAFASDGHVVAETRVFFVGEEVSGVTGALASDQAQPLEVIWRGIVLTASSLLFGVLVLYTQVLVPAWGSKKHTAGFLPPRVMSRLTGIAVFAFSGVLIGNVFAIIQNAMVLFNQNAGSVIANNLWNTARIGSRFGDVWNWRMLIVLLIGVFLTLTMIWRNEKPRTIAPFWSAMSWAAGLMLGTFAISSHASGSLIMPWVGILMHWLHLTAVALWMGGLVALALVIPVALKPYDPEQARLALLAVLRRFSSFATKALVITIVTGIYNTLNWLYEPQELTSTQYGISLIYKLTLLGGLLILGGTHHIAARPDQYHNLAERISAWRVTLPLEALFAVIVLASAGYVSATPPPTPGFINLEVETPRASQTVGDLTLEMALAPGGLGVNTYDLRVSGAADNTAVFMRQVRRDEDWRGDWLEAEPVESGLFVAAGDEFDTEGEWLSLIDVLTPEGTMTRAVFAWDINDAASVIETIPPQPQHWIALAAVLLALGWAVTPLFQRFMAILNLNAITGAIIVIGVIATALASVWGFQSINTVLQDNEALLNPPPNPINTVLPDQDSLQRGADQFDAACNWQSDVRLFASLVERLPRTRDDELYTMLREGWRDLPPCAAAADDTPIWDMVNYIRTYEPR